jgi:integrase
MTDLVERQKQLITETRIRVKELRSASKAKNTKIAIAKYWREKPNREGKPGIYIEFCRHYGLDPLPCRPGQLEDFLVYLMDKGKKINTIRQAKWAIDTRHKLAGFPIPGKNEQIKTLISGITRTLKSQGDAKINRRAAFTIEDIKRIGFADSLAGIRDKALLLIGWAGGFRRSELAGFRVQEIEPTTIGINIEIGQSKGNQEGDSEYVSIVSGMDASNCPVRALYHWLDAAGIKRGPVFRSIKKGDHLQKSITPTAIYIIVRKYAEMAGFNKRAFGGHSLRSGCASYLLDKGVPTHVVQKHMRHKSFDTTQKYNRNVVAKDLVGIY